MQTKKRHRSEIMPPKDFILWKNHGDCILIPAIRDRRTVSEQINRHDR